MSAGLESKHEYSACDSVRTWLRGGSVVDDPAALAADIRELAGRVRRARRRSRFCAGVELSPYVHNIAKMVGSCEIILPASEDN